MLQEVVCYGKAWAGGGEAEHEPTSEQSTQYNEARKCNSPYAPSPEKKTLLLPNSMHFFSFLNWQDSDESILFLKLVGLSVNQVALIFYWKNTFICHH